MANMVEHSFAISDGGTSQAFAISATSAQSAAFGAAQGIPQGLINVVITSTVDCFIRKGVNPVALSSGVDQYIVGGTMYRTSVMPGERIAAISVSGSGMFYITPNV
jgi:hypothetical protein